MLQLLLVFVAMAGTVCGEGCNQFYSRLTNDDSLLPFLNGKWFKVLVANTGSVGSLTACQQQEFSVENRDLTGYFQTPITCQRLDKCDTTSKDHYDCDITPILDNGVFNLTSTQRNSIKLVGSTGAGAKLCLIYSFCRGDGAEGLYVLCREKLTILSTVLFDVLALLGRLLGSMLSLPSFQVVGQTSCSFATSCPP